MILLFVSCVNKNYIDIDIQQGLYYGQNRGFFPQTIVFVYITNDSVYVKGFYPLKGTIFSTFSDTLYYSEEQKQFVNKGAKIYTKKQKLYFERKDTLFAFRVNETLLKYSPEKEKELRSLLETAPPCSMRTAQLSQDTTIMQNVYVNNLSSKILEHYNELGTDNTDNLNEIETIYFQEILEKTVVSFNFTNKKICYIGPGGLRFSNKQEYFNSLKENKYRIQNTLYFLNSPEKEKCDDYDIIVVYWNKKSYSIDDILKVFKKKHN
jgi:hypothetical protein